MFLWIAWTHHDTANIGRLAQYERNAAELLELSLSTGDRMLGDRESLVSMLREASQQSEPFQSLIHDYSLDVMYDPAVHLLFTTRLNQNVPMLRRINRLKTTFESSDADPSTLSSAMKEVLEAASALPASSHANMGEIANLVAVELAYRRIDQGLDQPLAAREGLPENTPE
jgi:hypothetical protein